MSELGNVFDALPTSDTGERGPDLHVTVQVGRSALGRSDGVLVDVPDAIERDGVLVARHREPDDPPGALRLHLAASLPDGARLRLRGQGGVREGGAPGDLFVQVHVVDDAPRRLPATVWIVAIAIATAVAVAVLASG